MAAILLTVLTLVLAITMCVPMVSGEVADDIACANHVHRECKCDFNAFEGTPLDKTFCKKLQACAVCISVPRCTRLKYLSRFVTMVSITIKLAKKTKICPHINLQKLLRQRKGHFKCSKSSKPHHIYDECGHRCVCNKGSVYGCTRIRKEFTEMSFDERRRYVDAYYKASTDPHYRDEFEKLLNLHSEIPSDFLHHMKPIFFPWHRYHLLKIENFLRRIDCRVTVPYYQWTARVDSKTVWRTTDPKDVWHDGPAGLGGNGVKPTLCVKTGRFKEGEWWMPKSKGGGCLKRNFNFKCNLHNQKRTDKLLRGSFSHFEMIIRENHHAMFHDCIGGNMPNNLVASTAPEYVLHHGYMDKLWDSFQNRGLKYKYVYYPSINYLMPFADMRGMRFIDNDNLPGGVAVVYQDMKTHRYEEKPWKELGSALPWNDKDAEIKMLKTKTSTEQGSSGKGEGAPGPDLSWHVKDPEVKILKRKPSTEEGSFGKDEVAPDPNLSWEDDDTDVKILKRKDKTSTDPGSSRKDNNVMDPDLSLKDTRKDVPELSQNDKNVNSKSEDEIDPEFEVEI